MQKFFVVGTGRSGTTLLQAMLMSSPGVYIPPETQFMGIAWQRRKLIGDIRSDAGWARAIDIVHRMIEHRKMTLDMDRFTSRLAETERSFASLFNIWLEEVASSEGADCIGEKSPVHARYVPELLSMCPGSKAVHIIRDPRDVAASQIEIWKRNAFYAAMGWRRDAIIARRNSQLLSPDVYRVVRYEEMVTDPERVIRPLCEHLGIDFHERMLSPHQRKKTGLGPGSEHLKRTFEPVTAKRVGRYRETLSSFNIATVETVCRKHMRMLGYEESGSSKLVGMAGFLYQGSVSLITQPLRKRGHTARERERLEQVSTGQDEPTNASRGAA